MLQERSAESAAVFGSTHMSLRNSLEGPYRRLVSFA